MDIVVQFVAHTPVWVYALFIYLMWRGLRSLKPREVTLGSLAVLPSILTVLGLAEMARRFGVTLVVIGPWLLAMAAGTAIGWLLLKNARIAVDRERGVLFRPADLTVIPLIVATFAAKYALGAVGVLAPELLMHAGFQAFEAAIYGLFAGIFVGKFATYLARYARPSEGERAVLPSRF